MNKIELSQKNKEMFRLITPFLIAMGVCLFKIITNFIDIDKSEGWNFIELIFYLPAAFILFALNFLIKLIFKDKIFFIWLVEVILLIIGIWILYYNFIL